MAAPILDDSCGMARRLHGKSGLSGRDFYMSLKAAGPGHGLPALHPGLDATLATPRAATAPEAPHHDIGRRTAQACPQDRALDLLSAKVGSMRDMPELQALISDTVSATLRGISSVVATQIDRTLETRNKSVVQDMVTRLLTEEVLRVTAKGAQELTRREIVVLQENQQRTMQSLESAQHSWRSQLETALHPVALLEKRVLDNEAHLATLRNRSSEDQQTLRKMPELRRHLQEVVADLESARASLTTAESETRSLHLRVATFEKSCSKKFATVETLERSSEDITAKAIQRECVVREQVQVALSNHVTHDSLEQGLLRERDAASERLRGLREMIRQQIEEAKSVLSETRMSLTTEYVTRTMLQEQISEERLVMKQIDGKYTGEVQDIKKRLEDQQALIASELQQLKSEREMMDKTFQETHTQFSEQGEELRKMLATCSEQVATNYEEFKRVTKELEYLRTQQDHTGDITSQLYEDFTNDRMRSTAIYNQQQQNRKELLFLGDKAEDIDKLRADMRDQQQSSAGYDGTFRDLQQRVKQCAEATSSQQELQDKVVKLQADIGGFRSEVAALADSQNVAIVNLRSMHNSWLGVAPPLT